MLSDTHKKVKNSKNYHQLHEKCQFHGSLVSMTNFLQDVFPRVLKIILLKNLFNVFLLKTSQKCERHISMSSSTLYSIFR